MSKTQLGTLLLLLAASGLLACGEGGRLARFFSSVTEDEEPLPFAWPPRVGLRYPDLQLRDPDGNEVALSSFAGKILLIEPIGMT